MEKPKPNIVFDPSIQSWILKHAVDTANVTIAESFRPFDPVVDTETQAVVVRTRS